MNLIQKGEYILIISINKNNEIYSVFKYLSRLLDVIMSRASLTERVFKNYMEKEVSSEGRKVPMISS